MIESGEKKDYWVRWQIRCKIRKEIQGFDFKHRKGSKKKVCMPEVRYVVRQKSFCRHLEVQEMRSQVCRTGVLPTDKIIQSTDMLIKLMR